ncbi:MAG: TonB-dependent receptor, partial [Terricaulis sp.]
GLYNSSDVRGFSPTSAGNARIDGLYFDQVWGLNGRLRRATTIRVGISAFGFPFPAPTGVVDYQMRRPGGDASQSAYASIDSYDWTLRAGIFRSMFDNDIDHFNLIVDLTPDGAGQQFISIDPPAKTASTSGEVRLTHTFTEGPRLHGLHFSVRGRERSRQTGGSYEADLGTIVLGQAQTAPQPTYVFGEQTEDDVRQWIAGVGYEGRWRNGGELNLGVQYTDYEKTTAQPGLPVAISQADLLLWNAALAINIRPDLVVYGGAAIGLEESGIAPISAANRNAALPAIETEQWEAGLRWRITPELRLIAGVFDVRKPYFNLDEASIWRELGKVRNRGAELSLSGQIRPGLTIVAGAILLDAEVTGEGVVLGRVGERPVGSTPTTLLFSVDWAPQSLAGVSLDLGVSYSGDIVATRDNLVEIPARTTLDLGVRYPFRFGETSASVRLQVTNVTDEQGFDLRGSGAYDIIQGRVVTLSLAADF